MGGTRCKAREGLGPNAIFYKLPHKGTPEERNKEIISELLSARVMDVLGVPHVHTHLVRAITHEGQAPCWVIKSKNYRNAGERSLTLKHFHELRGGHHESLYDFCTRMGWEPQIAQLILADYLTVTRDRDDSHIEVVRDAKGAWNLAPAFPRAFSLANAFPVNTWQLFAENDFDISKYLGSSSLEGNLLWVVDRITLPRITSKTKQQLMGDLYGLGMDEQVDACWEILRRRWARCESLCNL